MEPIASCCSWCSFINFIPLEVGCPTGQLLVVWALGCAVYISSARYAVGRHPTGDNRRFCMFIVRGSTTAMQMGNRPHPGPIRTDTASYMWLGYNDWDRKFSCTPLLNRIVMYRVIFTTHQSWRKTVQTCRTFTSVTYMTYIMNFTPYL